MPCMRSAVCSSLLAVVTSEEGTPSAIWIWETTCSVMLVAFEGLDSFRVEV